MPPAGFQGGLPVQSHKHPDVSEQVSPRSRGLCHGRGLRSLPWKHSRGFGCEPRASRSLRPPRRSVLGQAGVKPQGGASSGIRTDRHQLQGGGPAPDGGRRQALGVEPERGGGLLGSQVCSGTRAQSSQPCPGPSQPPGLGLGVPGALTEGAGLRLSPDHRPPVQSCCRAGLTVTVCRPKCPHTETPFSCVLVSAFCSPSLFAQINFQ